MYTSRQSRSQSGFTLAEVLVSLAIFAIIFIAALAIYDQSNKEFKSGVERSEMQQNTRVAFEKLVAEIRQAGFDFDRDGFPVSAGGAVWQPGRVYAAGNIVSPTVATGFTYVCTVGGTSNTTEPSPWNTTLGGTTNDGATVRWRTEAGINQYQQPDEQVEFAHRRAIAFRANLDYETDRAAENGRETALQSPQFPVVTTANDEIVTYALRSNSGPNPNNIQFFADVPDRRSFPGGRSENTVEIDGVDLCTTGVCTGAPYTLYRFTLTPGSGAVVEAPIATNVRDFDLTYYGDTVGVGTPLAFTPPPTNLAGSSGGGQYNPTIPNVGAEARGRRAEIKSVRVRLTGMSTTPTSGYANPDEIAAYTAAGLPPSSSPAYRHRTYTLTSLVVPRNLGKMGVRELQDSAPGEPALTALCSGWCGVTRLSWQAPPLTGDTGDVDQYIVIYDTVTPPVRFQKAVGPVTTAYIDGLDPTLRYFFTVAAVNSFGTTMAKTAAGTPEVLPTGATGVEVSNKTTPSAPSELLASGGTLPGSPAIEPNRVILRWGNPTESTSPGAGTSCLSISGVTTALTPPPMVAGEIRSYEILRGLAEDFDPTDPAQFTLVTTAAPNKLTLGASAATFEDNTAVACVNYYYRLRIVERCQGVAGATDPPARSRSDFFPAAGDRAVLGMATATAKPVTPTTLILPPPPAPQSQCPNSPSDLVNCAIYLQWPKVTMNEDGKPIAVRDYVVTRRQIKLDALGAEIGEVARTAFTVVDTTPGVGTYFTSGLASDPYYTDSGSGVPFRDPVDGLPFRYAYTVRAKLSCLPSAFESGESPEVKYPCPFAAAAPTVNATGMLEGLGTIPSSPWVTDPSGSSSIEVTGTGIVSAQVILTSATDSSVLELPPGKLTSGPFVFNASVLDDGERYVGYIIVKDAVGCQHIEIRYFEGGTDSGCCLEAFADNPLVMSFTSGTSFVDVFMRTLCADPLTIQPGGIRIEWDPSRTPSGTKLIGVEFPGETGGRVPLTVSDNTGLITVSLPAGARNPIRVGETHRVQLTFSVPIPPPVSGPVLSPVTGFCVSYQRSGVDITNQNCKIIPEPPPAAPDTCG